MIIKQIGIYTYQLPLNDPIPLKNQHINLREGALIRMYASNNRLSYGEAAPLPGLHNETLEEVIQQLVYVQSKLTGVYIPKLTGIPGFLDMILPKKEWFPSARFGLEMVLMNLYLLDDLEAEVEPYLYRQHQTVKVNLLAAGSSSDVIRIVKRGLAGGYRAVKLKVGQKKVEEDIALIKSICKLIGPAVRLRLDANRAWELDQALAFARAIQDCQIEYIEEPLKNPDQLPVFHKKTALPIALDETLIECRPDKFEMSDWINTLVLKPAAIGSLTDTLTFIRIAEMNKRKVVISDSFQSGVGFSFLLRLAGSLIQMIPMGFDTYQWFENDVLEDKIQVNRGEIILKQALEQSKKVKMSALTEFSGSLALNESLEN